MPSSSNLYDDFYNAKAALKADLYEQTEQPERIKHNILTLNKISYQPDGRLAEPCNNHEKELQIILQNCQRRIITAWSDYYLNKHELLDTVTTKLLAYNYPVSAVILQTLEDMKTKIGHVTHPLRAQAYHRFQRRMK